MSEYLETWRILLEDRGEVRSSIIKHNSLTSKNRQGRMPVMNRREAWERLYNFKYIWSFVLDSGEFETEIT